MAETPRGSPGRQHPDQDLTSKHFLIELSSTVMPPSLGGSWSSSELRSAELGQTSVAYLGCCLADGADLRQRSAEAIRRGHLAELTEFPGSFHVLVRSPHAVTVFGDVVGLRRVFYARSGDTWLVSDRADVLARRIGASLSDGWLALWLVWPNPDVAPLGSPWEGVLAVPPGCRLEWRPGVSEPRVERYWVPPPPDRSLREGAAHLADALATAVNGRVRSAAAPSCDLSGGKDTVALAFLADQAVSTRSSGKGGRLLAVTLPSISPDNDDVAWARTAATGLTVADHLVAPLAACPLPFDDLDDPVHGLDHPSVAAMHSARDRSLAAHLLQAGYGPDHLSGHGGDEVLEAPPAYVTALLPRNPALAVRRLRQHCALTSTSIWPVLRAVLRPGSYRRWLTRAAADLSARRTRSRAAAEFAWGLLLPPPPWLTDRSIALAAEALAGAAADAVAYDPDVGQHATLARIHAGAANVRLHQQFMARLGVRLHCPYLDRQVVEAALAVRSHERTDPAAFKPLLDAAMASTVPSLLRSRATKGHYSDDTAWGLYRNRARIARLLAGGRLTDRGLVDPQALQGAVRRLRGQGDWLELVDTVSCERWLRSVGEGA